MTDIREFTTHIWRTSIELAPGIPLHVHLIKGEHYAVWIDSGIAAMFDDLMETMAQAEVSAWQLRGVLHTHSHHDHIGCSGRLREKTGCLIAAHARHAHWHTDFEVHLKEFARPFPSIIPDTEALRLEVLDFLDRPHPVDILIDEGIQFDLGGPLLTAYRFSGHMLAELGFFESESATLILGDVITLLEAPFIHGHLTVEGYRESLDKIERLLEDLEVKQILLAHYPPQSPSQTRDLIEQARQYLDRLDTIVFNLITGHGQITLLDLWKEVCRTMGKRPEFRALNTIHAHVQSLINAGKIQETDEGEYGPAE